MDTPASARERDRQQVGRLKEAYFLGAGASKSILPSMPTAAELTVKHLLDPSNYPDGDPPRAAIQQLRKDIEEGRLAAGFGDLRLELLEALSLRSGQPWPRAAITLGLPCPVPHDHLAVPPSRRGRRFLRFSG